MYKGKSKSALFIVFYPFYFTLLCALLSPVVGPVSDFFLHHGFFLPSKMKEEVKMGWGGRDNIKL